MNFSSVKWLLACTALMVGCDFDIGGGTDGREGELEFSFAGNAAFDCLFGCDVDRPIAVGATSTLLIMDDSDDKSFSVRVSDGASASYRESFECVKPLPDGSEEFRSIEAEERCEPGEERNAARSVAITPSRSGTVLLEVLEDGEPVDAIELEARDVDSALVVSDADGGPLDEVRLTPGGTLNVSAHLLDRGGLALYFDSVDFDWTVSDDTVVGIDQFWLNFGPATSVALTANGTGSATLRFEAAGVTQEIPAIVE